MYLLQLIRGYPQFLPFILMLILCTPASSSLINGTSQSPVQLGQPQADGPTAATLTGDDTQAPAEAANAQTSLPPVELPSADLLVDQQQQHPHPKRNYASKDCGAKVLYWNAEAENRGAILNDPERDDYMRNPCAAQNKFLIIELCETIQPTSLEIANFELFSSSPRQFRLWGSERYPTQEWALIGEFEALDNREVQLFTVLELTSYAKFVKLELLTHYGAEHYCTLSTFRLYGTSMVDEYEAETVVVVDTLQQQQHQQQQLDSVFGRTFITLSPTNSAAVNEAVVASGQEDNERSSDDNGTTATATRTTDTSTTTMKTFHKQTERPNIAQRCRKCSNDLTLHCDWFCHVFFGAHQNHQATEMTKTIGSSPLPAALPLAKLSTSFLMEFLNQISPSRSAICAASSIPRFETCELNGNHQRTTNDRMEPKKTQADEQKQPPKHQQQLQQAVQSQQPQQTQSSGTGRPTTNKGNDESKNNDNDISSGSSSAIRPDAERGAQKQQQQTPPPIQQQTVQQPKRPTLDAKIVDKSNLTPLPGTSSTHKESVFMKLNKRLTLLEQNMSLSSEHLLELSRRCANGAAQAESDLKQQREGIAKEAERMAKQEANRVETEMKQKITELQREVRRLSQQLQSVQTTVQATGTGGFFYRPMLSPVHGGYSASDSHFRGEQACLVSDAMMGTHFPPMHSTSAAPYGVNSMPVSAGHSTFEGKSMDGLWTTSQVVYLMLMVQLGTLVMLKLSRVLFARVLHQCFSTIAVHPLSSSAAQLTPMSTPAPTAAKMANLTDSIMNASRHTLSLLNSPTIH